MAVAGGGVVSISAYSPGEGGGVRLVLEKGCGHVPTSSSWWWG